MREDCAEAVRAALGAALAWAVDCGVAWAVGCKAVLEQAAVTATSARLRTGR